MTNPVLDDIQIPQLTPFDRVEICRNFKRPHAYDFIKNICTEFEELSGDRLFRDDASIIGGLGVVEGKKFVIIGQEKGADTQERIARNFGMAHPEGYRKALRLMKMAEKFNLPVLSLIDTPGAYPGLAAEERGQGWAIAKNLLEMARLRTPIIVLVIGEGCSGGALGVGMGDVIAMLEHSYYTVISPESCASILWKDPGMKRITAEALKIHAEHLIDKGIIDEMIKEPSGGAHMDPQQIFTAVKAFVSEKWHELSQHTIDELLHMRYAKFRKLGAHMMVPV